MMLLDTLNAFRDIPRLHEISTTLIRHGWGGLLTRLGVTGVLERAGQILHWNVGREVEAIEPQIRMRRAMEELGPTFIKLGQVLATRVDVFPPAWITEFEKLQNEVPPVALDDLLPPLTELMGQDVRTLFSDLDPTPVGSASIAQVHRACLTDGTQVVLKIRRPGVVAKVEADLRILTYIANVLESEAPDLRRYQPTLIVAQFTKSLRRELDLALEARNIERFASNFAHADQLIIPRVYWEYTNELMNVQQFIEGVSGNNLTGVDSAGLDRRLLAARGADAILKMILIDGFFHADPHPGNVFYLTGNRLALIDFGMVGRLSSRRRNQIVDLLAALAKRDDEDMLEVLLDWTGDNPVDEGKLQSDLGELMYNYENIQLKDLRIGAVLAEVTNLMREHGIVMPPDLTLLFKAIITLEGLGRQLDPEFRMVEHMTPFVRQVLSERYHPRAVLKRSEQGLTDILGLMTGLPRDLGRLLKEARRGKVKIDLDLKRLDHFGHQLDRSTNRLTLGIMTASLVDRKSVV